MIIAIDFDGCIVEDTFPDIKFRVRPDVMYKAKSLQAMGHQFILWTCREGHHLHDALDWIEKSNYPINFTSVNQEPQDMSMETRKHWKKKYRSAFFSRKINADYYVDDKSPGSIEWFLGWDGTD